MALPGPRPSGGLTSAVRYGKRTSEDLAEAKEAAFSPRATGGPLSGKDEVRAGHQSHDRQGTWRDRAADAARAGRRGHRVRRRQPKLARSAASTGLCAGGEVTRVRTATRAVFVAMR